MSMLRTSNPALNEKAFKGFDLVEDSTTMTLSGTVNKTAMLLLLLVLGAGWTWHLTFAAAAQAAKGMLPIAPVAPWLIGGLIVGLICSLCIYFRPQWAPVAAPIHAIAEGLFLGVISALLEMRFELIVVQAVGLTISVLAALLMAYKSGLIRATENFKLGVCAATGAIGLVYLVGFILSFFGVRIPYIHEAGLIGICFSLFVVVIASLNLVLDFDFIEEGVNRGAPKYMEWYGAFGLLVTLVWLYIEVLRLLMKLRAASED